MTKYQLYPCLTNGNQRCWQVQSKTPGFEYWTTIAWTTSIKGGKSIIAHLRRKPIAVE